MKDLKPILMTALGVAVGMILVGIISKRFPALSSFESDYETYEREDQG